ncbi:hypothetical protein C8Q74DRAFT_828124 [Fomes fomentarius]|nr:hypothetical protein C8Q74DRAFT_828124 [Fomes fomentarius]
MASMGRDVHTWMLWTLFGASVGGVAAEGSVDPCRQVWMDCHVRAGDGRSGKEGGRGGGQGLRSDQCCYRAFSGSLLGLLQVSSSLILGLSPSTPVLPCRSLPYALPSSPSFRTLPVRPNSS